MLIFPVLGDNTLPTCAFAHEEIHEALKTLDHLQRIVPHVPPDEAAYMQKEEGASLSARSEARFNALIARRFYYPHKLHLAFENAKNKLEKIASLPRDASIKRRIQVTAAVPTALFDAKRAWDKYVIVDNGKIVDPKEIGPASFRLTRAVYAPESYIMCLAGLLEGY